MKIILLFIGLILGIMWKDLFRAFRIISCVFTSYFIIDLIHPNTFPSFKDLDFKYIFTDFRFKKESAIYIIINWLTFYWVVKKIMYGYFKRLTLRQKEKYESFDIERDMPVFFNIIFNISLLINTLTITKLKKGNDKICKDEITDNYIDMFLIFTNITFIICLYSKRVETISFIFLLFLLFNFLVLPNVYVIFGKVVKYTEKKLMERP